LKILNIIVSEKLETSWPTAKDTHSPPPTHLRSFGWEILAWRAPKTLSAPHGLFTPSQDNISRKTGWLGVCLGGPGNPEGAWQSDLCPLEIHH